MNIATRARHRHPQLGVVHTLHPGDVACATRGDRMETLLGSCVSIVLTDPRRTIGAMCHVVHSRRAAAGQKETSAYGAVALETMYALLIARGIAPSRCQAYVYGGGNMFPALVTQSPVGMANAQWALDALADAGIEVVGKDLGGTTYRRLGWTVGPEQPQVTAIPI